MELPLNDADLAAALARRAGRTAHEMRQAGVEGWRKSSAGDLVTAADHAAEELVVAALAEARPGDGVVGEEGAATTATTGRTWFVDPVDGTYNFVNDLPWWCSALALRDGGQVVLGAVYHPGEDQVWVGGPDLPTNRSGQGVPPLADRGLADCSLTTYLHPSCFASVDVAEPFGAVAAAAKVIRAGGSGSMDLAAVADGRLDLWCQHGVAEWDWMPGFALVEGAGGAVAHVESRGITWSLAGPSTAVNEAADLLRSA